MEGEKKGVLPIDDVKSALMYVPVKKTPATYLSIYATTCHYKYRLYKKKTSTTASLNMHIPPSSIYQCALLLTRPNRALDVPPSSQAQLHEFLDILDPESDGYTTYEPFFAICALQFHAREQNDSEAAHQAQVLEAFRLFTNNQEGPITLAHLRRVAAVLKEDVDDEMLKDMILEANGGGGVARGVRMEEFDEVMRNAGVWR